ncbi:hypothetical protein [Paenarthrobacter sp. AB444]|uniref:hypothetical protein n=1 Tax=Paenarthrobacter sp. AB444 TaxID=3025681 RepID=UPI002365C80C|nr:hypothetical protein [Paenarthrobacter sp. AB444]MDD7833918.1 hypothetical protein [Paenarthrobacter sp. AB444]
MQVNPVLKPRIATPALIVLSAVTIAVAPTLMGLTAALTGSNLMVVPVGTAALILVATWTHRIRALRRWESATREKWRLLEGFRQAGVTTTEVTLLSVDEVQPTGTWTTIHWNRFDYVQPAWIEALAEPVWPGSVLLIKPDPRQIKPGAPWPSTYRISSDEVLAWAPLVRTRPLKQSS